MTVEAVAPTGRAVTFPLDDIIVSKTDLKGRITYANRVFIEVSGYTEEELLGAPHNIIRHPDMPGCVFAFLWDTIAAGHEVFAYVVNMARSGDHYWVHAHVTPTFDANGRIIGYHSNRRVPRPEAVAKVEPLYAALRAEEAKYPVRRDAVAAGMALLGSTLEGMGLTYEEFVWRL